MSSPGISVLSPPPLPPRFAVRELPTGIRVFTNDKIQSAVDAAISSLDPEDRWAFVAHHVYDDNGARIENVTKVSAVVKLKDGWSIGVGAYKDWAKGDQGAEAKIILKG